MQIEEVALNCSQVNCSEEFRKIQINPCQANVPSLYPGERQKTFSKKLTFLTSWYAHTHVCVSGGKKIRFSEKVFWRFKGV